MVASFNGVRFDSLGTQSSGSLMPRGQKDHIIGEVFRQMGRMDSARGAQPRYDAAERVHVDRALRLIAFLANPAEVRLDANETGFLQKALTHISLEEHPTLVPPLEARKWIPTVVEGNPGDASYLWRKPTRTGIAQFFGPGIARDLPVGGAYVEEINTQYYTIGMKILWDYFELLAMGAAVANGQPFNFIGERLTAALEGNEKKLDLIAAFGSAAVPNNYELFQDADVGLTGLLNNASISNYAIPVGAAGSKAWVNKTADEVLADLFGIVSYQVSTTAKVHTPNTMLLPIPEFQAIANRRMSDISDSTILSFFLKSQKEIGQPIDVYSWQYMAGSGQSSSDQMIVYARDTRMGKHVLSTDKAALASTTAGLVTEQVVYSRTAGWICFYPLAVTSSSFIG